jgi:hypothetical protein
VPSLASSAPRFLPAFLAACPSFDFAQLAVRHTGGEPQRRAHPTAASDTPQTTTWERTAAGGVGAGFAGKFQSMHLPGVLGEGSARGRKLDAGASGICRLASCCAGVSSSVPTVGCAAPSVVVLASSECVASAKRGDVREERVPLFRCDGRRYPTTIPIRVSGWARRPARPHFETPLLRQGHQCGRGMLTLVTLL